MYLRGDWAGIHVGQGRMWGDRASQRRPAWRVGTALAWTSKVNRIHSKKSTWPLFLNSTRRTRSDQCLMVSAWQAGNGVTIPSQARLLWHPFQHGGSFKRQHAQCSVLRPLIRMADDCTPSPHGICTDFSPFLFSLLPISGSFFFTIVPSHRFPSEWLLFWCLHQSPQLARKGVLPQEPTSLQGVRILYVFGFIFLLGYVLLRRNCTFPYAYNRDVLIAFYNTDKEDPWMGDSYSKTRRSVYNTLGNTNHCGWEETSTHRTEYDHRRTTRGI